MAHFIFSAFSDESGESKIKGQIAACKENGIAEMELRGFGKELNINNMTVEQAKEIKKTIDEEGMKVSSIGSAYGKINIKDDFEPHFEAFKNTIEVAKILEAKYIRIFSFFFDKEDGYDEYKEEVIRRVKAMVDYADENGIMCCHENEKGIYGDTAERCLEVLEACGGKLRAVFDPANFVQCGVETYPHAFNMLREFVVYMHIKDAKGQTVVPAGSGDGHVPEIISELYKSGYEGFLSLEPHLGVFGGLAQLEKGDEMMELPESDAEKFTVAADALKKIISEVEKNG